jgi:hypothetical protein
MYVQVSHQGFRPQLVRHRLLLLAYDGLIKLQRALVSPSEKKGFRGFMSACFTLTLAIL